MACNDRRSGINNIKPDSFMFPFVEVTHLLLTNEGDAPFSNRAVGSPPRDPLHSSLLFVQEDLIVAIFSPNPWVISSLLTGKTTSNPSIPLIHLFSNLHFFPTDPPQV